MSTINTTVGIPFSGSFQVQVNEKFNFITYPSWFSWTVTGGINSIKRVTYTGTAPSAGTFTATYQIFNTTTAVTTNYTITIIAAVPFDPFERVTDCCKNIVNIAWLNPLGGWSSYVFKGLKTDKITVDGEKRYLSNNIYRDSEIKEVLEKVVASTSLVPKHHIDFTASLRYSIQAFLYNTVTKKFDIPIYLDRGSFTPVLYNSRSKRFEFSFEFTTKKLLTQTQ